MVALDFLINSVTLIKFEPAIKNKQNQPKITNRFKYQIKLFMAKISFIFKLLILISY